MGHLLTRARRVLQGKLAGLLEGGPAGHGIGAEVDSEFEPDLEDASTRSGEPAAEHAAIEARARAFAILEVAPDVTPAELRSSYRRLCRRYHPDRFDHDEEKSRAANELLAEVNAAYALLTNAREAR